MSAVDTSFASTSAALHAAGQRTPTTPRPAPSYLHDSAQDVVMDDPMRTPVRPSFEEQDMYPRPAESSATPVRALSQAAESTPSLKRDVSLRSPPPESIPAALDIDMMDGEEDVGAEDDGSDNDSINSDSHRPSKKKKGQRFFCTDFPPCQLSFTRSEHLARHIRKHTGERPFQCHCSRRFSRLDNLRQHAQTVHVNEEIPGDSLAATSTRFQRQIRTDRVRPPTSRSRASTIGSNAGHGRGHSRNLSTSSIASTASNVSSTPDDTRRRPQPLAMANDPAARARLSLDTYSNNMAASPQNQYAYYAQSPSGYSSPTSTAFSIGASSPRFQSGMASPVSTISRASYYNGARQARRMSGPPGPNPFQHPQANTYPTAMYFSPMPPGSPGSIFSQNSSVFASPVTPAFSHSHRESETEMEFRRRTWHPNTYTNYMSRPPTSGLSYHQTPDDHHPTASEQSAAGQTTRLPGIESFDHAPVVGSRQASEAIASEGSPRPPRSARPSDAGLHQNLTRLDIAAANAPTEGQWQATQSHPHTFSQGYASQHQVTVAPQQAQAPAPPTAESPVTPRKNKRQAWYGGPVNGPITPSQAPSAHRPSPEDSGSSDGVPTPGTSQGTEYHPVIVNPNGPPEAYASAAAPSEEQKVSTTPTIPTYHPAPPHQTYALQSGHDPRFAPSYSQPANNDMGRLEALVAVATSETRATEQRS